MQYTEWEFILIKMAKTIHECYQQEVLDKFNHILLGDGKPENGLLFKQLQTHNDICLIKDTLSEVKTKNDDLLRISSEIKESLAQITGKALGIKESENHIVAKRKSIYQILTIILAFTTIVVTIIISNKTTREKLLEEQDLLRSKIDLIEVSPVTRDGSSIPVINDSINIE